MKVTGDQVAALRPVLTGDVAAHERLYSRLDPASKNNYGVLIVAAFFEAAYRKFGKGGTPSDVAEFVKRARARSDDLATSIDPRVAERLILATFTDEQIDDISDELKGGHYILLLAGLIADFNLSDSGLEAFLDDARKLADEWLAEES
ncbi:hypothetical protein [Actinoallomurus sp. NPDC050550]|uniref:hypothetical protein n=1 Tax=Actinoallomurus sp. NPDC050550 TaxID=3154937 RepID=UPI003407E92E